MFMSNKVDIPGFNDIILGPRYRLYQNTRTMSCFHNFLVSQPYTMLPFHSLVSIFDLLDYNLTFVWKLDCSDTPIYCPH